MKICKWHPCRKSFWPEHNRQEFCSADCRHARHIWKRLRGAPMIDALLENDTETLLRLRKALIEETR